MKVLWVLCMVSGGWGLAQLPKQKKPPGWGMDLSIEHLDAYLYRGLVYDDQPGQNLNFSIGVGQINYSYFTHRAQDKSESSIEESNHSLEMTWLLRGAIQTMGYRMFDYSSGRPDTQEIYYRIAYQTKWHWTFGTFMDIDAYKGYYFDLSGNRMMPISRRSLAGLKLYLAGSDGLTAETDRAGTIYEYGYFGDDGLSSGYAKLYYRYQPRPRLSFEAAYRYNYFFDDQLDENPVNQDHKNVFSFKLRYVFP